MELIKNVVNQDSVKGFSKITGKVATIYYQNESVTLTNVYEKLDCLVNDCCICFGESQKEHYDYSIFIHKIKSIECNDDNILINFFDGNNLLIVTEH